MTRRKLNMIHKYAKSTQEVYKAEFDKGLLTLVMQDK